jgi:hypothetical protein
MRLGLLVLFAAGCSFHASFDGTHYKCGAGDTCPSGQACVAGECVIASSFDAPPGTPDTPPGTPDGPVSTPDAPMAQARCGSLALLRDGFDSNSLGTTWNRWSDGGPTAQITSGHLSITIPSNGSDLGAGFESNYAYDFTGSEARATISKIADVDTILEVRDHRGAKLQMVVENGTLYAGVFGNVAMQGDRASVVYDPAVHKKWRLREASGVAYWEWSTDGLAWTELWHEADPLAPQHVIVELSADGNGPSEARFEELNVETPMPSLGLCAASSITDDFPGTSFDPQWLAWADTGASSKVANGAAVIATDGAAGEYAGFQSRHLLNLRGDTFYLDANAVAQVTNAYSAWAEMIVPGDGNTRLEIGVDGPSLNMYQRISGMGAVSSKSMTYDATAHRFWRFRADASNVYFDTSPDATTWTQRFQAGAQLDPSALQVVIGAGSYNATGAHEFHVGSVNLP